MHSGVFLRVRSRATFAGVLLACWACGDTDGRTGPPLDRDSVLTLAPADTTLRVNESVQLSATLVDPESQPIASFDVAYHATDPAIAGVDPAGLVTGFATGQTFIVGTVGGAKDTTTVTVPMSFADISAGFSSCGIRTGGEARCWGLNHQGELGSGAIGLQVPGPVTPVGGLSYSLIRTSAGFDSTFTCGLTQGGATYCWGSNTRGQLGTGDVVSSPSPRKVQGDGMFVGLDVGFAHACALTAQGEAFCWGSNDQGQLGTGDSTSSAQPVAVATGLRFAAVRTGGSHSCGLLGSGAAYCWGGGDQGQLGTGTAEGSPVPALVLGDHGFTSLDAGNAHTCGIAANGEAYCWGYNIFGEVGTGQFVFQPVPTPSLVVGGRTWNTISAGSGYTCGISVEGPAYCWGIDADGRLGIGLVGTPSPHPTPELLAGDEQFTVIATGYDQTCAISGAPGQPLFCWGRNNRGQLDGYPGDFMTAVSFAPRLVSGF